MILHATADKIRLETDEAGWEIHVETDEGDRFVFNIHGVAFGFAGSGGFLDLWEWRNAGLRAEKVHLGE